MDQVSRSLVNLLQMDFPLTGKPFSDLGMQLGLSEQEVLHRIEELRQNQIIRILGPVFNSRALGYHSTLVAMRVPEANIEQAARIINQHPGVGHNYQREHENNLWFTLAAQGDNALKEDMNRLADQIHPEVMFDLPAKRLFKIRLFFDLEGNGSAREESIPKGPQPVSVQLTNEEKAVIREVQGQLPITSRPFDDMAKRAGMEIDQFLSVCRSLQERGIMRRFGASIEHQNAGFTANAMVCWQVLESRVSEIGNKLARFKEVTHCYERKTNHLWPKYNIFAMIHGNSKDENADTISRMTVETGITQYEVLTTVREFKKERVRYEV
jgi:DNA-binding Lrp family transcriptional regulator